MPAGAAKAPWVRLWDAPTRIVHWALVAVTRMSALSMALAPSVPAATSFMSGTTEASSPMNWRSSWAVLAETRHSAEVQKQKCAASGNRRPKDSGSSDLANFGRRQVRVRARFFIEHDSEAE